MFSYRHAFHAGNHADVLKHITLLATLRHLMRKPTGLLLVDTHAGAGLYRLDSEATRKAAEAQDGILKLRAALASRSEPLPEALKMEIERGSKNNSAVTPEAAEASRKTAMERGREQTS